MREDCNQYAPTTGRPRLKKIISQMYSPLLNHPINPITEVLITTGANEGIFSALIAFLEPGDEVIIIEPLFN
jgi:kynurenine aminotransferase